MEAPIAWDELTQSSKTAFGCAVAVSSNPSAQGPPPQLNSEALLAGIMLAHDPDSEPDQLLRHFRLSRSDLQDAGMSQLPDRGGSPATLDALPPMGPDAEAVLEKAAELSRSLNPDREKLI